MNKVLKWIGITGSWRQTSPEIEERVRTEVQKIISSGNGIVTGGALNVDYQAADEVLKSKSLNQLKIFLPTSLEIFTAHYKKRVQEGLLTETQVKNLITQLTTIKELNPSSLIENNINTVVNQDTYYERNSEVVNASDELMAFQVNNSEGVQDTINKAKEKGIPVKLFPYDL
ncbi:MAG: hypothetical protein WCG91_00445 [Candidatus Shapirobacteria bacterium]